MPMLPILEIHPGDIAVLIPIIALMIPIVKMLVSHQQKMAEIIHGTANRQSDVEVAQLRQEVYELKQLVHQQMIALDTVKSAPAVDIPLQKRLEQM
jgi:uncharacterized membrane protein (DUF106 family)